VRRLTVLVTRCWTVGPGSRGNPCSGEGHRVGSACWHDGQGGAAGNSGGAGTTAPHGCERKRAGCKTGGWMDAEGSRNRTVHFGEQSGAQQKGRESGPDAKPIGSLLYGYSPPTSDGDAGRKVHGPDGGTAGRQSLRTGLEGGGKTARFMVMLRQGQRIEPDGRDRKVLSLEQAGGSPRGGQVFGPGQRARQQGKREYEPPEREWLKQATGHGGDQTVKVVGNGEGGRRGNGTPRRGSRWRF